MTKLLDSKPLLGCSICKLRVGASENELALNARVLDVSGQDLAKLLELTPRLATLEMYDIDTTAITSPLLRVSQHVFVWASVADNLSRFADLTSMSIRRYTTKAPCSVPTTLCPQLEHLALTSERDHHVDWLDYSLPSDLFPRLTCLTFDFDLMNDQECAKYSADILVNMGDSIKCLSITSIWMEWNAV